MRNKWFKSYLADFYAIGLLLLLGLVPFSILFTSQPFIYGDNSFHYAEFYEVLTQPILSSGQVVHWNPDWFAGIPELQFYPIGFAIFGILINSITFHLLPIGLIYNLMLLIALIFPSIAGYLVIRKLGFDYIAAFFSGLFLMILTYIGLAGGFYYGVIIGLFSSRIAFGMSLLTVWFSIKLFDRPDRYRYAVGISISLALTILFHPDHLIFPISFLIVLILLSYYLKKQSIKLLLKSISLPIILGISLTAFWLVPMIANHGYTASMQVWSGKIKFTADWPGFVNLLQSLWNRGTDKFILFLYFCSIPYFYNAKNDRNKKIYLAALMVTPIIILISILIIKYLGIGLLQITAIDPARLIDGIAIYLILVAGIGLYQLVELTYRYLARWQENRRIKVIGGLSLLLLFFTLYYASFRIIYVYFGYPKMFETKAELVYVIESYQLNELWDYLGKSAIRNPPPKSEISPKAEQSGIKEGRILITAIGLPIKGLPGNFKSQALSLTPIYTGRQIIGGLNTPFYPIASHLYFGKIPPMIIHTEADKFDNRSMFGIPWEQMEETKLTEFCQKLNITDIVVNQNEDKVIEFFNRSSSFRLDKQIDEFNIYTIPGYQSTWLDYDTTIATIQITEFDRNRITLSVSSATKPTPILIKVAYYPCWNASLYKIQNPNSKIQIRIGSDEIGLMRLSLPQGDNYQVQLLYQRTGAETFGYIITIISILVLLSFSFFSFYKKALAK